MSHKSSAIIAFLCTLFFSATTQAQTSLSRTIMQLRCTHDSLDFTDLRSPRKYIPLIDRPDFYDIISTPSRPYASAIGSFTAPAVYDTYELIDTLPLTPAQREFSADAFQWLDDYASSYNTLATARQKYIFSHPGNVQYNQSKLPAPPKTYRTYVDPISTNIVIEEINVEAESAPLELAPEITYKKWLYDFNASLQFSQAYISPNWYQGGNNNLNMIGFLKYHFKLNPKFHPKVLFETTLQYKLALNSAPDDSIHAVNISEDIFQINSTFGLKAAKRWYYSANLLFKTQLFNSYPTNSRSLKSAFMSPGQLNVGVGMTYNYESPKKNFNFGASLSPLSWDLKTCYNHSMPYIENGHRSKNSFGSSAELTMKWKMAYNVTYNSRLFMFTDYSKFQGDWEHTLDFNINKFLSTRLYAHMRYDTRTQRPEPDSKWHKFQFKEIFSFGFTYNFGV